VKKCRPEDAVGDWRLQIEARLITENPVEKAAFAKAKEAGAEAGWEAFLKEHPGSRHEPEAKGEIEDD
jgi:hypothetical protein